MRLTYSEYKDYNKCPLMFYKKKTEPVVSDDKNSFYGTLMQKFFELYIKEGLNTEISKWGDENFSIIFYNVEKRSNLSWVDDERSEMVEKCKSSIPIFYDLLDKIGMLDNKTQVEVKMEVEWGKEVLEREYKDYYFGEPLILAGRWDFYLRGVIADGKGTKSGSKGCDPDQLLWYACQYYEKVNKWPEQLLWVLFHPKHKKIEGVAFNQDIMDDFKKRVVLTAFSIYKKHFLPKAAFSSCLFCDYVKRCPYAVRGKNIPDYELDTSDMAFDDSGNGIYRVKL